MSLTVIAIVILIGLILISIEVFLVTGTTFVGIFGLLVVGVGTYYGYKEEGAAVGSGILIGSAIIVGLLTTVGLKRIENSKFNVKTTLDGRVNEFDDFGIKIGAEGITLTALRPEGKALINDKRITVHSKGSYIDNDVAIEVVKIKDNKIFVDQKV